MATTKAPVPEPADAALGRQAVELGLITEMQLQAALSQISGSGTLSQALVRLGLLTERQLDALQDDTASVRRKLGKYSIVRVLGRGGMGVVYEAIDVALGRTVALKMLVHAGQTDPREAALDEERFIREARTSANLPPHPGIVGVYESGVVEGRHYIAMEYIPGCHFEDWRKKSTGSLRGHVAVLRDVAMAVDHAHRHGIIHRDLKPANVLIDSKGHPHVTDFGLAKKAHQDSSLTLTGGGQVMGTPSYISPEQAAGRRDVDRRSDVWALGIMLYELLAGRLPFRGETPIDIMMKMVKNPVPPPSTVARASGRRHIDPAIERICLKALEKDPRHRYASAKLFADDLSRWIKGDAVEAETTTRRPARRPVYGLVLAAGAVLAAVVVVVLLSRPARDTAAEERRVRAADLVAQGQRCLQQGRNADALVAFARASEAEPGNPAAASGKLEAERRITAAGTPKTPAEPASIPRPAPPPAPGRTDAARDLLAKAAEFTRSNPRDIEGQVRLWQEVRTAAAGTPWAAEAVREYEAALARRRQAVARELEELDHVISVLREGESFGPARDVLAQAVGRHDDPEWTSALEERRSDLRKTIDLVYRPIKEQAQDAKRRGDAKGLQDRRERVARWKWPEASADLEEALSKVEVRPPSPAAMPVSAPVPGNPPAAELAELAPLQGHSNGICSAAFSPDGKLMLSASFDLTVRLWNLPTRTERVKLVEALQARSVAFSPDGKWLAAGLADGTIRLWDSAKLQPRTLSGHSLQVLGLAFAPDSRLLASASTDGSVRLWDPVSAAQRSTLEGHSKGAMCLAWAPDGKTLAAGAAERQVKLWEIPAGRERRQLTEGIAGTTLSVAFSSNGRQLVSGGEGPVVHLWDTDSGRHRDLTGHTSDIRALSFSPDAPWIASASADGSIRIWDGGSGETLVAFTDPAAFFDVDFSRQGDLLAGGSGSGSVRFWDLSVLRSRKSGSK